MRPDRRPLICCCLLLLLAAPLPAAAASGEYNDRGYAVLANVEREDGIDFTVRNLQAYDITVTITLEQCENLRVDGPLTFTVPGGESRSAVSLTRNEARRPWLYYFSWHWNFGNRDARHDAAFLYTLPYPPGHSYPVLQGYHGSFSHFGQEDYALDWSMPEGTPVCAARAGVVVGVRDSSDEGGNDRAYIDKANYVYIRHDDGTIAMYLHFRHAGVAVAVGQQVAAGEIIGYSGNTGFSTEPHLHFTVCKGRDGFERESLPTRFLLADGSGAELEQGVSYQAPDSAGNHAPIPGPDSAGGKPPAGVGGHTRLTPGHLVVRQPVNESGRDGIRLTLDESWGYGFMDHRISFVCELRQRGQLAEQALAAETIGADPRHWVDDPSFFFAYDDFIARTDRSQPLTACFTAYDETAGVELARGENTFYLTSFPAP